MADIVPQTMVYLTKEGKMIDALSGAELTSSLPPNMTPFWGYFLDKDGVEHPITDLFSGGGGGGAVSSVNGKTGVVVLTAPDLGVPNVMSLKGQVATETDLPATANVGDVYQTEDTKYLWAKTETEWISLGASSIDLSEYYSKTESDSLYMTKGEGTNTYYTKAQTESLFTTHKEEADAKYQAKLTAGANINITEDNVISANGGGGPTDETDPVFIAWRDGDYGTDQNALKNRVSQLENGSVTFSDDISDLKSRMSSAEATNQSQTQGINTLTTNLGEATANIAQNQRDIDALESSSSSMASSIANLSSRTTSLDQNKANKFVVDSTTMDLEDVYNARGISEAPKDGKQYARQNGSWTEVTGGSINLTKWVQKETGDGSRTNWSLTKGTAMYIQGVRIKHTDNSISILWQEDDYVLETDNSITLATALPDQDVVGIEYVGRA